MYIPVVEWFLPPFLSAHSVREVYTKVNEWVNRIDAKMVALYHPCPPLNMLTIRSHTLLRAGHFPLLLVDLLMHRLPRPNRKNKLSVEINNRQRWATRRFLT